MGPRSLTDSTWSNVGCEAPIGRDFSVDSSMIKNCECVPIITRKLDLFDLPTDVLLRIFRLGGTILRAESVCRKWRTTLRKVPDFWHEACHNVGLTAPAFIMGTPRDAILGHRQTYLSSRHTICQHCLSLKRVYFSVLNGNARLCYACSRLDAYCAITLTDACRLFAFNSKCMLEALQASSPLETSTYISRKNVAKQVVTLYRFWDIYKLYASVFGWEKANQMAERARDELRIGESNGVDLKDV